MIEIRRLGQLCVERADEVERIKTKYRGLIKDRTITPWDARLAADREIREFDLSRTTGLKDSFVLTVAPHSNERQS